MPLQKLVFAAQASSFFSHTPMQNIQPPYAFVKISNLELKAYTFRLSKVVWTNKLHGKKDCIFVAVLSQLAQLVR